MTNLTLPDTPVDPDLALDREAIPLRARLLEEIDGDMQRTQHSTGRGQLSAKVRAAMARVPRHRFVPGRPLHEAYANRPLPIGEGQTISQPYIVALMSELADLERDAIVLEIGTGCGYQSALLAELAGRLFSVEIIPRLAAAASARLKRLGYRNVAVRVANGRDGWPEHAPFDAIVVTAAAESIPSALIEQLRPGGRLVIPIGPQTAVQSLLRAVKSEAGSLEQQKLLPVAFVPLVGADVASERQLTSRPSNQS